MLMVVDESFQVNVLNLKRRASETGLSLSSFQLGHGRTLAAFGEATGRHCCRGANGSGVAKHVNTVRKRRIDWRAGRYFPPELSTSGAVRFLLPFDIRLFVPPADSMAEDVDDALVLRRNAFIAKPSTFDNRRTDL
jgi:hypothetical protein